MSSDEVRISSSLYATVSPDRTHSGDNTNHNNLSTNNTNNNMSTTHSMNTTRSTSTGRSSRSASATISSTQVQVPIRGVGVGVGVEAKVPSDDNHDYDNSNSSYNNNDNNNDRDNYISNNNSIEMTTPAYLRNGNFHPHQPPVQTPPPVQPSQQPQPQPQKTISLTELKYGISSFHVIITPVTLTMILSALAVTYIQTPEIDTSSSLNDIYNVFDVSDEYSVSRNIGLSLINAFIIVCAVAAATFVLVFFYKYRCMRCLSGYMILSSALLLGLLGSLISMVAIQKYKITIDSITFYILLFNFAIVGTMSIFYCRGIPPYITQSYLVVTSVILAWQLSQFNNWTAWCLLVLLALYDLCAVLTPCGPLKALIGLMSKDGAPALPGLLYEAQLPNGVERPSSGSGNGSGSGNNNGSSENGTSHSNRNSNDNGNSNGNGIASENERQNKRKKNRGNGDINGVENSNNHHSHSHSHEDNQQMTGENNNISNIYSNSGSGNGSGSNMNAEMEDEEYMSAMGTGTHIRIGAGTGNGTSSFSSNDNTNRIAENQIQHQNRHDRNRNNGNSNDNRNTNSNTHTRAGKIPLAIAIIYKLPISSPLEFATQNVTNLPPPSDRRSQYTPKQLRTRVVVHFPRNGGHITNDDDDSNNGMEEDNSEVEPSSTTTSRIRSMFQKKKKSSSSSTSSKYIVYDRHENVKRILVVNREGRVFEEVEGDDNDSDNALSNNSIKLGLGDFIFYSVLVSKAAQYSFTTFATCVLVILAGLGSTLVLLSVYHMALPALPISIFLGVTFYFLTRILMEPFLIQAIFELSVYV